MSNFLPSLRSINAWVHFWPNLPHPPISQLFLTLAQLGDLGNSQALNEWGSASDMTFFSWHVRHIIGHNQWAINLVTVIILQYHGFLLACHSCWTDCLHTLSHQHESCFGSFFLLCSTYPGCWLSFFSQVWNVPHSIQDVVFVTVFVFIALCCLAG